MSAAANKNTQDNIQDSVQELVQGVVGLISLPDVCVRVKEMVDNPECSAADIGKVVIKDAALTARLLRIVNSAFYQFPARIETVSRAITIVGNRELKDLVFAATVAGIFEKVSSDLIEIETFWRHAVYCGIVSRIIARKSRVLHSERLFVAGLMHDIGQMVIAFKLPDQCREIQRYRKEHDVELHAAENHVLGFDHSLVGAELMKAWSLPQSHQLAALHHHSPEKAPDFVLEASIVYLANIITELAEAGTDDVEILRKVPDAVWRMTKVSIEDIEDILVEARDQFIDALTLIRSRESKSSHHVA
ncbi:MAG: HDOD domain-containing protein [Gammaproteobacteria bacterium]|nr:HDOD domain-containing protein [Gammaproteobacteria bacterium]